MELKDRIEKVLSEILSDKYECKVTIHFEKKEESENVRSMQTNAV